MADNRVRFGLEKVHYAISTYDEINNEYTYSDYKELKGAVNLTLDSTAEATEFYADNVAFYTSSQTGGFSGTLEIANITDDFRKDVFGTVEDGNGVLVDSAGNNIAEIALAFQVEGSEVKKRVVYYVVKVANVGENSETNETSIDPQTLTLDLSITPRINDKKVRSVVSEGTDAFGSWFDEVYDSQDIPTITFNSVIPTNETSAGSNDGQVDFDYDAEFFAQGSEIKLFIGVEEKATGAIVNGTGETLNFSSLEAGDYIYKAVNHLGSIIEQGSFVIGTD